MKILDKIGLAVFSIIILISSIVLCIILAGWADAIVIADAIEAISESVMATNITIGVAIIFMLLAIKCIFFNGYIIEERRNKDGIILENESGKLLISRDTIENLASTVVKTFNSAEAVTTKVEVDKETNIKIFVTLFVYPDAVIKELTNKLVEDIKTAVKKSIDIDVKEVNIKIKDITPKKETVIKE